MGWSKAQLEDPIVLPKDPDLLNILTSKKEEYEERVNKEDVSLVTRFKLALLTNMDADQEVNPVAIRTVFEGLPDYNSYEFDEAVVIVRDYATTGGKNNVQPSTIPQLVNEFFEARRNWPSETDPILNDATLKFVEGNTYLQVIQGLTRGLLFVILNRDDTIFIQYPSFNKKYKLRIMRDGELVIESSGDYFPFEEFIAWLKDAIEACKR